MSTPGSVQLDMVVQDFFALPSSEFIFGSLPATSPISLHSALPPKRASSFSTKTGIPPCCFLLGAASPRSQIEKFSTFGPQDACQFRQNPPPPFRRPPSPPLGIHQPFSVRLPSSPLLPSPCVAFVSRFSPQPRLPFGVDASSRERTLPAKCSGHQFSSSSALVFHKTHDPNSLSSDLPFWTPLSSCPFQKAMLLSPLPLPRHPQLHYPSPASPSSLSSSARFISTLYTFLFPGLPLPTLFSLLLLFFFWPHLATTLPPVLPISILYAPPALHPLFLSSSLFRPDYVQFPPETREAQVHMFLKLPCKAAALQIGLFVWGGVWCWFGCGIDTLFSNQYPKNQPVVVRRDMDGFPPGDFLGRGVWFVFQPSSAQTPRPDNLEWTSDIGECRPMVPPFSPFSSPFGLRVVVLPTREKEFSMSPPYSAPFHSLNGVFERPIFIHDPT